MKGTNAYVGQRSDESTPRPRLSNTEHVTADREKQRVSLLHSSTDSFMSSRLVHGLRLRQLTPSSFSSRAPHLPSSSRTITTTFSFDPSAYAPASPHPPSPTDSLVAAKTRDLLSSLEREDSKSSRPWSHYVDLLNYMGLETLPLEVHQLVLRKCVPPARVLRAASRREGRTRRHPHAPHMYENRLQTVMKNIRSAGWQADLDDYHFILEQFAAVGHYIGSRGATPGNDVCGGTTERKNIPILSSSVGIPAGTPLFRRTTPNPDRGNDKNGERGHSRHAVKRPAIGGC